jgi:putative ABC transport system permease protein
MDTILQDLRFGIRTLRKDLGFAAVAVLALALGIGANSAIFSVVNAILLRPLGYENPDQLVLINHNYPKLDLKASVSAPGYVHYRDNAHSFSEVAALSGWSVNLTGGGEPERLQGSAVTTNFFATLGAEAAKGRVFLAEEGEPGRNRSVVLSDAFWQRRFGGDPDIIGKTITLNGEGYTVVGVMPPGFQFGRELGQIVDLWSPIAFTPEQLDMDNLTYEYLVVLARLKPDVSFEQAQAELDTIAANLLRQYMPELDAGTWNLALQRLNELVVGDIRPALLVLLGAVGFVLLIACANVANLLLARAAARDREFAVRMALGAGRSRVVRQLLTESVLLALIGGGLGLILGVWGVRALVAVNQDKIPRAHEIGLDLTVLGFTLGVSALTGIIFGLVPALQAFKGNPNDALKEGGRGSSAGKARRRALSSLVVVEMALAVVLLVGAGLLIRSFLRLQQVDPGFQPRDVVAMQLSLPDYKYGEPERRDAFYQQLLEQVRAVPGVKAAGAVSVLPLSGQNQSGSFRIEGREVPQGQMSPHGDRWVATSDYFRAMSVPLVRGRYFTDRDTEDAPGVAIVDESMARKYWPGEDPIGKRITFEGGPENPRWREIVGIVGHVRHRGLEGESRVQYYVPYRQRPVSNMFLVAQATGDPTQIAGAVRGAIRALDADLPVYRVTTMERLVADSLAQRRFAMLLLGVFAALALVLAAVGLFGVIAYVVTRRTHEIGVRLALGAQRADVLRLVLGHGMGMALVGVGIGLVAAFALARLISGLLYGVSATDPLTFVGVGLLLVGVAFLASYIPARRATRVDPMIALRYE